MQQNRTSCSFLQKRPVSCTAIVPLARTAKVRERELTMSTDEAYTALHHEGNDLAGLLGEQKSKKLGRKYAGLVKWLEGRVPGHFTAQEIFLKKAFCLGFK